MLILSRVCAEFRDHTGAVVYRVTPESRLTFREAPDSIREDLLFRMLINDGSMEAAVPEERRKLLEQNPAAGHDASGKTIPVIPEDADEPSAETKAEEKPAAKPGKTAKADKPAAETASKT